MWRAIAIGGVLSLGWFGLQYWQSSQDYERGYKAYKSAKCHDAIANFNKVIQRQLPIQTNDNTASARAKIAECGVYIDAVTNEIDGDYSTALLAYNDFIEEYGRTYLTIALQQRATGLFSQKKPISLVNRNVCEQLDSFVDNKLMLNPDGHLPPLYRACGDAYVTEGDNASAILIYEKFLDEYPEHEFVPEVQIALARTLIADAEAKGVTEIPQPPAVGQTTLGYTEVEIQNDSPAILKFAFTGAEEQLSLMESCPECQIYEKREETPEDCPAKGPVQRFKLKPGEYNVAVNSVNTERHFSFRGNWNLEDGVVYRNCFILVGFPVDNRENDIPGGDGDVANSSATDWGSEFDF